MVKQPFYLFKRKLKSKKSVYYWYCYDSRGNRTTPKSTGYTRKQEAFNYVLNFLKTYSPMQKPVTFGEFTNGLFDDDGLFIKEKRRKKSFKEATVRAYRNDLKVLQPFFNKYKLNEITTKMVEDFMVMLSNEGRKNSSINHTVAILKIIMDYAKSKELIDKSPFDKKIEHFRTSSTREAFSQEEIVTLLSTKWSNYLVWLCCLTDAVTGLRISELLGLREDEVKDGYIDLQYQYIFKEIASLKTEHSRFITLPKRLEILLREQIKHRCSFIFSKPSTPNVPISKGLIRYSVYKRYTDEMKSTQKQRVLTLHSFRYYFNTYLISHGISETKTNFCLGHSSGKGSMLTLYTTWKPEMYDDVRKLQDDILDSIFTKETIDFIFENNALSSPDQNLFLERLS